MEKLLKQSLMAAAETGADLSVLGGGRRAQSYFLLSGSRAAARGCA